MKVNPDIIKSCYIWAKIREIIESKNTTISKIAEKMWVSQPSVSRVLSWKVWGSDNFFIKAFEVLWLSQKEMTQIFKEADLEKYKYKYWEDLKIDPLKDIDFNIDVALRKEYWKDLDDATIQKIKDFIEHVKFLKKK